MGTIDSKKLRDALAKAKNIGLVEETFTLGDCEVTLRSLRPTEYTAVLQECQGLNDVEYLHAYQQGHVARSIVGLNGIDFHDIQFVEDEEADPKRSNQTRVVKVELHDYLIKNVLSTWSKEIMYTAYRKFGDVLEQAERKAKEGVTFLLPEETEEDKYRRLLLEAKELEEALPSTLVDRVLEDIGLMRKSTADEIKAAMEKADQHAREQAAVEPPPPDPETPPPAVSAPAPVAQAPVIVQPVRPPPVARQARPVDPHQTLEAAIAARNQAPVAQAPQAEAASLKRAAAIAALEDRVPGAGHEATLPAQQELPATLPSNHGPIEVYRTGQPQEAVEITKQDRFDPQAAEAVLEQKPVAGINPRFRPPATRV